MAKNCHCLLSSVMAIHAFTIGFYFVIGAQAYQGHGGANPQYTHPADYSKGYAGIPDSTTANRHRWTGHEKGNTGIIESATTNSMLQFGKQEDSATTSSIPETGMQEDSTTTNTIPEVGAPEDSATTNSIPQVGAPEDSATTNSIAQVGTPEDSATTNSIPQFGMPEDLATTNSIPQVGATEDSTTTNSIAQVGTPEDSATTNSIPQFGMPEDSTTTNSIPEVGTSDWDVIITQYAPGSASSCSTYTAAISTRNRPLYLRSPSPCAGSKSTTYMNSTSDVQCSVTCALDKCSCFIRDKALRVCHTYK